MNKGEVLIKLQFKNREKEFLNTDHLREFLESQRNSWSWLQEISSRDISLNRLRTVYSKYFEQIDDFLNQYEQHKDHKDRQDSLKRELLSQTQQATNSGFLLNDNIKAKFVAELKEKTTRLVAAYALMFLAEQDINPPTNVIRPVVEGICRALQFLQGNTDTVKIQQDALESMRKNWCAKFGEQHNNLRSQNDQLIKEIAELKSKHSELIDSFKTEIEESKKQLKEIEHTYDEKLALQSSVQYLGG